MSWAEVKKINSNMDVPLNSLFGTKINMNDQKFIDEMELETLYPNGEYYHHMSHAKNLLYDKIWSKHNKTVQLLDQNTSNIASPYTYETINSFNSYAPILIGDTIFGFCYTSNGSSDAPIENRGMFLLNFKTGEREQILKYPTTFTFGSVATPVIYKLDEFKYVVDVVLAGSDNVLFKYVILLEFNEDTTHTVTLLLSEKDTPSATNNIITAPDSNSRYLYECAFYCGKYLELKSTLSNDGTSSSNLYDTRYLFDIDERNFVEKSTPVTTSTSMKVVTETSKFFDFDSKYCIKLVDSYYSYATYQSSKEYKLESFNNKYNYCDGVFYVITDDRYDMPSEGYSSVTAGAIYGKVGYDMYLNKISVIYNSDTGKVEAISSNSVAINKTVFLYGYVYSTSYYWLGTDIECLHFLDDDTAICIPPYFNGGKSYTLTYNNYHFYARYRNNEYKCYVIKNIRSDNPIVEYFEIPGFDSYGNENFNSLFINSIIGFSTKPYVTSDNGTYRPYIGHRYPQVRFNKYNICKNRIVMMYTDVESHNACVCFIQNESPNNNYYTHSLSAHYLMSTRSFDGFDDFMELLKELYLLSVRTVTVIKGMKLVSETSYISRTEGVKLSMDEDDNNILQAEKTGVLKIYMTLANPETNPLMLTF